MPDLERLLIPDVHQERDDAIRTLKAVLEVTGPVSINLGNALDVDRLELHRLEGAGGDNVRLEVRDPARDELLRRRAAVRRALNRIVWPGAHVPDAIVGDLAARIVEELDREEGADG